MNIKQNPILILIALVVFILFVAGVFLLITGEYVAGAVFIVLAAIIGSAVYFLFLRKKDIGDFSEPTGSDNQTPLPPQV